MKETMFISPFDAMWREIGCLYRALEIERAELESAVAGVSAAQAQARPARNGPSVADLLRQYGAEEAAWINRKWRGEELPRAWQSFVDGTGSKEIEALVAWLRDVREATRLKLMKASDADLDRQTIATEKGAASLRWVLHRLLDQAAFARGQIALLRTLGG